MLLGLVALLALLSASKVAHRVALLERRASSPSRDYLAIMLCDAYDFQGGMLNPIDQILISGSELILTTEEVLGSDLRGLLFQRLYSEYCISVVALPLLHRRISRADNGLCVAHLTFDGRMGFVRVSEYRFATLYDEFADFTFDVSHSGSFPDTIRWRYLEYSSGRAPRDIGAVASLWTVDHFQRLFRVLDIDHHLSRHDIQGIRFNSDRLQGQVPHDTWVLKVILNGCRFSFPRLAIRIFRLFNLFPKVKENVLALGLYNGAVPIIRITSCCEIPGDFIQAFHGLIHYLFGRFEPHVWEFGEHGMGNLLHITELIRQQAVLLPLLFNLSRGKMAALLKDNMPPLRDEAGGFIADSLRPHFDSWIESRLLHGADRIGVGLFHPNRTPIWADFCLSAKIRLNVGDLEYFFAMLIRLWFETGSSVISQSLVELSVSHLNGFVYLDCRFKVGELVRLKRSLQSRLQHDLEVALEDFTGTPGDILIFPTNPAAWLSAQEIESGYHDWLDGFETNLVLQMLSPASKQVGSSAIVRSSRKLKEMLSKSFKLVLSSHSNCGWRVSTRAPPQPQGGVLYFSLLFQASSNTSALHRYIESLAFTLHWSQFDNAYFEVATVLFEAAGVRWIRLEVVLDEAFGDTLKSVIVDLGPILTMGGVQLWAHRCSATPLPSDELVASVPNLS